MVHLRKRPRRPSVYKGRLIIWALALGLYAYLWYVCVTGKVPV